MEIKIGDEVYEHSGGYILAPMYIVKELIADSALVETMSPPKRTKWILKKHLRRY